MTVCRASFILPFIALSSIANAQQGRFDIISTRQLGPNVIEWRIDRPNVRTRRSDYPEIRFQPGDRVTVQAGGCVNVGGSDELWRRYVDPRGEKSDRRFFGLIHIPGATTGLTRISSVVGQQLVVSPAATKSNFLRLGYEDDEHEDNSYQGDEGDRREGQCSGEGAAHVVITVQSSAPAGPGAPPGRTPPAGPPVAPGILRSAPPLPPNARPIAETFDEVTVEHETPEETVYRIDRPNVRQYRTHYRSIRFEPGDVIRIRAGGCVQTGSPTGEGWRRYVDPQGTHSDFAFHGMVEIPGATQGMVHIAAVEGTVLHVPPYLARSDNLHLRLGYQDCNYEDNGYYASGRVGEQCAGEGPAYVIISVERRGAAAPASPTPFRY